MAAAAIAKTFTRSLTSAIASGIANKVLNAGDNAKVAKKERAAEGLEEAKTGSLFVSALKTEFGGDLFNKVLGRKKIDSTTPKPSDKPNQSSPVTNRSSGDAVKKAEESFNEDDGNIPVKDEQVRKFTARLLGAGLENKLNVINYSVGELSNEVKSLNTNLVHTQKLVYDQNELLGAKFDSILDIFSAQRDYQKEIVEAGKVERREAELEQKQDLSSTQKIEEFEKSKKKGQLLGLSNLISNIVQNALRKRTKNLLNSVVTALKGKTDPIASLVRNFARATFQGKSPLASKSPILRRIDKKFKKGLVATVQSFTDYGSGTADQIVDQLVKDPGGAKAAADFRKDSAGQGFRTDLGSTRKSGKQLLDDTLASGAEDIYSKNTPRNIKKKTVNKKQVIKQTTQRFQKGLSSGAGVKATNKAAEKLTGKVAGKTAQKSLKFVPGIGTGISIIEAGYRASQGDTVGAMLSLGSAVPFIGWGFVAADIARDLGYDPLDTMPDQYETGSGLTKPGMGILHGTEARITNLDRENSMDSMLSSMDTQISMLVSSARSLGDSTGTSREIQSEINKTGVPYEFVRLPFQSDIGRVKTATPVSVVQPVDRLQQIISEQKIARASSSIDEGSIPSPNDYDPSTPGINAEYSPDGPISYKSLPNNAVTIFRGSGQGPDTSGEHGIDFSFNDYSNNYAVFPGEVVSVKQRSDGYGMSVTIRSKDPLNNNQEFESLYAHFDPKGVAVTEGSTVHAGQYLGKVGWDPSKNSAMPGAGGMSGWHTSLDFYEPNGGGWYRNASDLIRYVEGIEGRSPTFNFPNGKDYSQGAGGISGVTLTSHAKRLIGDDTAFLSEVSRLSRKYGVNPADMLALFASESRFDPAEDNGTHVGLIQFSEDSARAVGTTQAALLRMSRAEQMKYVEKYFDYWGVPKNATAGHLYAVVFAPAYASKSADFELYRSPSSAYNSNAPLDTNNDGAITIRELGGRIQSKKAEFGINDVPSLEKPNDLDRRFGSGTTSPEVLRNIRINDELKERYKNDPAAYFGTKISSSRSSLDEMERISSSLNDTEESVAIQTVIITKTVVAKTADNSVITSNTTNSNLLKDYQMAVLGA